jgi:hypothetical protein
LGRAIVEDLMASSALQHDLAEAKAEIEAAQQARKQLLSWKSEGLTLGLTPNMSSPSLPPLLESLANSVAACLDANSLSAIAHLELDPSTQDRLDELAEKANEGTLTSEERAEYQGFIGASEFLGLAQLRARARLGLPLVSWLGRSNGGSFESVPAASVNIATCRTSCRKRCDFTSSISLPASMGAVRHWKTWRGPVIVATNTKVPILLESIPTLQQSYHCFIHGEIDWRNISPGTN